MKRNTSRILLVIVFAAGVLLGQDAAAQTSGSSPMVIKWAAAVPASPIYAKGCQMWADEVTKRTNGRVKIETYFGGSVLRAGEELEGIQNGLVEGGLLGIVYYPSKLPGHNITYAVPFGPSSVVTLNKIMYKMYEVPEFVAEVEQYNQKLIFPGCLIESYDVLSKRSIKTLADFKGKKMASITNHLPMVTATGAVPVNMPATERYMAMQTGVIDSTLWGMVSANTFRLNEVAKYLCVVDFGACYAGSVTINRDVWRKISPEDQKLVLQVGKESAEWLAKETDTAVTTLMEAWKAKGVEVNKLSDNDKKKWAEAIKEMPLKWAKELDSKGKPGSKVLKAFVKASEESGFRFPYKME